jgi:hypothetical protein
MHENGDPKVTEQDLMAPPQQQVLWLDIAMDYSLIMSELQGVCHLPGIGNSSWYRKECSSGVALTNCAVWSKIHHQKGSLILNTEIQNAYNIGMDQGSNDSCLTAKRSDILTAQLGMQHLNRRQHSQVNMPTEIDLSKATLS